jgi:hypothetical protein
MNAARMLLAAGVAAALCGCGTYVRKEIEGNNTGGVIPFELAKTGNPQALANAHCGKWNSTARITFSQTESGGDVVFVCETPALPAPPAPPPAKQAPAPPRPRAG